MSRGYRVYAQPMPGGNPGTLGSRVPASTARLSPFHRQPQEAIEFPDSEW